jgi:hypothetical protein
MRSAGHEQRERVLTIMGADRLSGYEVLVRLAGAPAEATGPTGPAPESPTPEPCESLLYPTLHGLEAGGRLAATWSTDAAGRTRRLYRRP